MRGDAKCEKRRSHGKRSEKNCGVYFFSRGEIRCEVAHLLQEMRGWKFSHHENFDRLTLDSPKLNLVKFVPASCTDSLQRSAIFALHANIMVPGLKPRQTQSWKRSSVSAETSARCSQRVFTVQKIIIARELALLYGQTAAKTLFFEI